MATIDGACGSAGTGSSAKPPAMKGTDRCYKHQEQADIEQRRRKQFTLPPLVDLKTVQRAIWDVAQALLEDRIDEEYAGELLQKLQNASIRLRSVGGVERSSGGGLYGQ